MGVVYLGTDIRSDLQVAIKTLSGDQVRGNLENLERFIREGEVLRQLDHPNIVKMLETFEWLGEHFLVMEYVAGGDLADLLAKESPLPIERVLSIALELADALTRAHHLKVIHRDIKPANALLAADGTLRLTDFGIAALDRGTKLTEKDSLVGTIAYLSPEACLGQALDECADIWSFGVLLYELLLGEVPFGGEHPVAIITAIMGEELPDLQELRADIPDGLVDLVYRMLVKDREGRIPSARLVGAELEGLIKGFQITPTSGRGKALLDSIASGISTFATPAPEGWERRVKLPAQTTRFIGREEELNEIARLLGQPETRLLTLFGAGGMGKTRLGIEAARAQADSFADGVCFVDLAPLSDPEEVPRAMAEALQFTFGGQGTPREQILAYLRKKELLLVLDNFEHLVAGAPFLSEILANCPGVKLLPTSRARLNLQDEQVFEVTGMRTPKDEAVVVFEAVEAVELFISYARRARPDYELGDKDKPAVVRICRLVEGMPLGVQLAAGWAHSLSPQEVAEELNADLDLLTSRLQDIPERQGSIRAVFDYSWKLLPKGLREIFMRCSIFRGGFTREAAKVVAGATVRALTSLVEQSMLQRAPEGRFHVHELMRQFAEEALEDSGQNTVVGDSHAAYYLRRMAEKKEDLQGGDQLGASKAIAKDFENVGAAWYWAVSRRNEGLILPALESLHLFCSMRSLLKTREELFRAARAQFEEEDTLIHWLLICYHEAARFHYAASPEMIATLHQAVESIRKFGEPAAEAKALAVLGQVRVANGLYDQETIEIFEQSLQIYEALGDKYNRASLLHRIGFCTGYMDDGEKSQEYYKQALALRREINDLRGIANAKYNISVEGGPEAQVRKFEEVYRIYKQLGDRLMMAWTGVSIAGYAIQAGDMEKARPFIDEGQRIIDEINHPEASLWVLWAPFRYFIAKEDYERAGEIVARWEKLPVNALRPQGQMVIRVWRIYLDSVAGNLNRAKAHARSLGPYVEMVGVLHYWILFAFSTILELESRHELALEFITYAIEKDSVIPSFPSTARMLERIEAQLPEEVYQAAEERGKALDPADGLRLMKEEGYF